MHECGFIHRDIKPGNIMIGLVGRDARQLYLIDYGMNIALQNYNPKFPHFDAFSRDLAIVNTLNFIFFASNM